MGFDAQRKGGTGEEDVLVVAPIADKRFTLSIEAKGSKHPVGNDDADVSAAARHRNAVEADHAVIVARKFAGFDQNSQNAAILGECIATGGVSVVEVDALVDMCRAVRSFQYPLQTVYDVLTVVETPNEKRDRISALQHPTEGFDFRGVLDEIWAIQQGLVGKNPVPIFTVMERRPDEWAKMEPVDFVRRIISWDSKFFRRVFFVSSSATHMYRCIRAPQWWQPGSRAPSPRGSPSPKARDLP